MYDKTYPPSTVDYTPIVRAIKATNPDVVFIASSGLEAVPRFTDFARYAPLRDPVRVTAWRCPRATIPVDPEPRTEWLDREWQRVDDWVSA